MFLQRGMQRHKKLADLAFTMSYIGTTFTILIHFKLLHLFRWPKEAFFHVPRRERSSTLIGDHAEKTHLYIIYGRVFFIIRVWSFHRREQSNPTHRHVLSLAIRSCALMRPCCARWWRGIPCRSDAKRALRSRGASASSSASRGG